MAHAHSAPRHRPAGVWQAYLVPFPAVCFTLALLTDLAYWRTSYLMWQNFSSWLLFAGLIFAAIALVVGAIELIGRPFLRRRDGIGSYALGSAVVLALAFLNSLVHAADGWWAVMPWGLALSVLTFLTILVTAWASRGSLRPRTLQFEESVGHA
jgi:uncharacterized membrane protein